MCCMASHLMRFSWQRVHAFPARTRARELVGCLLWLLIASAIV